MFRCKERKRRSTSEFLGKYRKRYGLRENLLVIYSNGSKQKYISTRTA